MSNLDELDDEVFTEAIAMAVNLCRRMESATGRKPTCNEFLDLLAVALQSTHRDIFSDISPTGVASLVAKLKKKPGKIMPGTLIAVPSSRGKWHLIVYLTSNRFGDAFGIIRDCVTRIRPKKDWRPAILDMPIYSGLDLVREGKWRMVDFRPELLTLFPSAPEIYHAKKYHIDNPDIGNYGSAESPTDKLRKISQAEAEKVGLLNGKYRAVVLEEGFVEYLERVKSGFR